MNTLKVEKTSKASIVNKYIVEVITSDGDKYRIISDLAKYESDEYKNHELSRIEAIFNKNMCEDKELMYHRIVNDFIRNAIPYSSIDYGRYHEERVRIGAKIRELRQNKNMEAKDLALMVGIDTANLCRIEQGKYSTGLDILTRISRVLGAKVDIVEEK